MLKIAVCDDIDTELRRITMLLNEYLTCDANIKADLHKFSHPDALMIAIETEIFHIYVLDIVMPMINGLELGKEIRRFDREAQIIYATTEPQFALQAYAANPINYLIKPIDKNRLFETMSLAISKIDFAEERTITVKTADSLRVIKYTDIAFCEYHRHTVIFHLISGEETVSRTIRVNFSEYCSVILKDRRFLQCHTSFIVNMRRIECFARDGFTLYGGKIVPISPKQYPVVRDTYMDYLMAKEGDR